MLRTRLYLGLLPLLLVLCRGRGLPMVRRREALSRGQLAAWILIVVILPVLGTILYFAVGRPAARAAARRGRRGGVASHRG